MKLIIFVVHCFFVVSLRADRYKVQTQDQTSPRANTLLDDRDDIQKQLDNEALDRKKLFKTVWVFHLPTRLPGVVAGNYVTRERRRVTKSTRKAQRRYKNQNLMVDEIPDFVSDFDPPWTYKEQNEWFKTYPACGGASQSPVDLPYSGLGKTRGARKMIFSNYDTIPKRMWLFHNGRTATLYGDWAKSDVPVIYGGAAHSRCYLFHSMVVHWPSEHAIGGLKFPLETQALFISSMYRSIDEAVAGSNNDQLAFLTVSTLYKFSDCSHNGTAELLTATVHSHYGNNTLNPQPLGFYSPMFKEYAVYHGSLSQPPCTESVLWLIRARSMPITRDIIQAVQEMEQKAESLQFNNRQIQRMNDRKVYLFN